MSDVLDDIRITLLLWKFEHEDRDSKEPIDFLFRQKTRNVEVLLRKYHVPLQLPTPEVIVSINL